MNRVNQSASAAIGGLVRNPAVGTLKILRGLQMAALVKLHCSVWLGGKGQERAAKCANLSSRIGT